MISADAFALLQSKAPTPLLQESAMLMDAVNFPIVRLLYDRAAYREETDIFAALEALLDRKTPFVIIGQNGSVDGAEHEHDPAERKRMALWSKKHKPRLRALVKAMINVEPSATKRLGMKPFMTIFEKLWGYPMLLAASEAEALEKAAALLLIGLSTTQSR